MIVQPLQYALIAALLASLLFGGTQCSLKLKERERATKAETDTAVLQARIAQDRADFSEAARAQEQLHAEAMARIGQETAEQTKRAGDEAYNRAVADVRAGRLRNVWTCPSAARVPDAQPGAGEPDAGTDDRGAAIAAVLRIAAECDAHVRGLQAVVAADRQ